MPVSLLFYSFIHFSDKEDISLTHRGKRYLKKQLLKWIITNWDNCWEYKSASPPRETRPSRGEGWGALETRKHLRGMCESAKDWRRRPRSAQQGSGGASLYHPLLHFFLPLFTLLLRPQRKDRFKHSQTQSGDPALHLTCKVDRRPRVSSRGPGNETGCKWHRPETLRTPGLLNCVQLSFLLHFPFLFSSDL